MKQFKRIKFNDLPEKIRSCLQNTAKEADNICNQASAVQKTKIDGKISFIYTQSAPMDILSDFEKAQSVCFISRYEHLPIFEGPSIFIHRGKFFLENIGSLRQILNEYRPIIQNQTDSVYYTKIHKFCREKLMNADPSKGLSITVEHEKDGDITSKFTKILDERNKSLKIILKNCEFGYIYNGILQHSDHQYTKRFLNEYNSGKINHIFIKHAFVLGYVKDYLLCHYKIINQLTFPKLGPI